jgi:hypothetical protein
MPSSASVSSGSQKFHSWAISCLTMAYSQSRQDQECSWVGNDTKDWNKSVVSWDRCVTTINLFLTFLG